MPTLSSLLVQRSVASMRAVEDAIAQQVLKGGDLATNVLEVGAAREGDVARLAAESAGLTALAPGKITPADPSVLKLLPGDLAARHGLFPIEKRGGDLVVATSEPLSQHVDEDLGFLLNLNLRPVYALRVRIVEALAEHYGQPFDRRYRRLLAKLEGRKPPTEPPPEVEPPAPAAPQVIEAPAPAAAASPAAAFPPARPTLRGLPAVHPEDMDLGPAAPRPAPAADPVAALPATIELSPRPPPAAPAAAPAPAPEGAAPAAAPEVAAIAEPARQALVAWAAPPLASRSRRGAADARVGRSRRKGPFVTALAQEEMQSAISTESVLEIFFDFAQQFFEYAALFVVHGDIAEGRDAAGRGADRERVSAIGLPLDLPSTLANAREQRVPVLSDFREGLDVELLRDVGRAAAGTAGASATSPPERAPAAVIPLVVRGRAVALFFGDDSPAAVDLAAISDVIALAGLVGASIERIVLRRKQARAGAAQLAPGLGVGAPARRSTPPAAPRRSAPAAAPPAISSAKAKVDPRSLSPGAAALARLFSPAPASPETAAAPATAAPATAPPTVPAPVTAAPVTAAPVTAIAPATAPPTVPATPDVVAEPVEAPAPPEPPAAAPVLVAPVEPSGEAPTIIAPGEDLAAVEDAAAIAPAPVETPSDVSFAVALEASAPEQEPHDEASFADVSAEVDLSGVSGAVDVSFTGDAAAVQAIAIDAVAPRLLDPAEMATVDLSAPFSERPTVEIIGAHVDPPTLRLTPDEPAVAPQGDAPEEPTQVVPDAELTTVAPEGSLADASSEAESSRDAIVVGMVADGAGGLASAIALAAEAVSVDGAHLAPRAQRAAAPASDPSVLHDAPPTETLTEGFPAVAPEPAHLSPDLPVGAPFETPPPLAEAMSTSMTSLGLDAVLALATRGAEAQEARAELARRAERNLAPLIALFPGPLDHDRHRSADRLPPASQCGPLLEALTRAGSRGAAAVAVLARHDDVDVRFWAAHVLGEIVSSEAADGLLAFLVDPDLAVRRAALRSASSVVTAMLPGRPLEAALGYLARDGLTPLRERVAAIEAMGHLRAPVFVPALIGLLGGPPDEVGETARRALLVITRQDFGRDAQRWEKWWASNEHRHRVEWLVDALMHETQGIRRAAGEELKNLTKEYFGYYDDLPKRERERAQERYREWWEREGRSRFQ